ncbi:uncharacterized protein LOC113229115 isoform X2 [Hyposmocoma kahamanoa]|uniref:uncharacterized protein LOC113229115 isoform X2 n=1 Tax=Hyposmocoma kahamanoa TaxID=1477025 RepID=UPI000E6D8AEA|nr:uncharacterized protein LOC113229115 isoform X2 [Hyposmocoma kahamanoa]
MYDLEESLPAAPQPSTLYLNVPIRNSPSTDKNISERTTASVGCPNATNFESLANEIPVDLNRPSEIENKRPSSSYRNYECGEPMRPQHLRIDFSPSEQDDNEETEMKCIDFFKYLQGRPDIQRLMVTPVLVGWEVPTQPSTVESMKEEVEDKEQAVYWMEVLALCTARSRQTSKLQFGR